MTLDEKTYERMAQYYAPLLARAKKLTQNRVDAEDLVQTAYLKLLKCRTQIKSINTLGLLAMVIFRLHYNKSEHRKRYPTECRRIHPNELIQEPEQETNADISDMLNSAMGSINDDIAACFYARGDELRYKQIADLNEMSLSTLHYRKNRALQLLRPQLKEAYRACFPAAAKSKQRSAQVHVSPKNPLLADFSTLVLDGVLIYAKNSQGTVTESFPERATNRDLNAIRAAYTP
jgi:RNA polymerase sigma factor (sigma-70 family)